MMAALLKNNREGGTQRKSGGEQRLPAVDTAGTGAVSPSLDRSDDGTGSHEEERGDAAEADPTGYQLGCRGQDWGDGPLGEPSITVRDILRSRPFLGQPKMAVPTFKGRKNSDSFSKKMRVYAELHGFQSILDSHPYVEVGAEGSDCAWPRG